MSIELNQNDVIVILEIGGLGDFIMATPTIKIVRDYFPKNPIILFVAERSLPLAKSFSDFELNSSLIIYPFYTTANFIFRNVKNILKIKSISKNQPGLLIDLSAIETNSAAIRRKKFIKLFKSKITAGRNTNKRGTFHNFSSDEVLFSKKHEVERKLDVLKSLNIKTDDNQIYFPVDKTSRQIVKSRISEKKFQSKRIVGINIGAYRTNRRWPVENIINLINNLTNEYNHFLIFGGPGDEEFIEKISHLINPETITIILNKTFQIVGAWLETCDFFITNDTGLMHFAAALKIPTIALFGPENPFRYAPWGDFPKCIIKYYPEGKETFTESNYFYENAIKMIETEQVLEAARAYLETGTFTKAD